MNGEKKLKKKNHESISRYLANEAAQVYKHKLKDNDWELNISWKKTMPSRENRKKKQLRDCLHASFFY